MSFQEPEGTGGWPSNRLIGAAAAVALLVVAAAVVVIATHSSGHGRRTAAAGTTSPTTRTDTTTQPSRSTGTATATTAPVNATTSPATATTAAITPSGGPVPADFEPTSFTAVSDDVWWLIGSAKCSNPPCESVVRTVNGGRSFVGIPAPRTDRVTELRFANAQDGYAYGEGIWSTHDGGASWTQTSVGAQVQALETGGGYVYAATSSGLLRSPVGADHWSVIHTGSITSVWVQGDQVLADDNSGSRPVVVSSSDSGTTFAAHAAPPSVSCNLETTDGTVIWAECATGMDSGVWRSDDGGVHWTPASPRSGTGGESEPNSAPFAAASADTAVYGASQLYRTTDGGASWSEVPGAIANHGSWLYLGFTDATHGVAIVTDQNLSPVTNRLDVTTDGGASYTPVAISSN